MSEKDTSGQRLSAVEDDTVFTMGAKMFKDCFTLMCAFEPIQPQLRVKANGVQFKQMDEARVGLVDFLLPRVLFKGDYKVGEMINRLQFDSKDMDSVLSSIAEGDLITLSINNKGGLKVTLKGRRERIYNMPLFEPDEVLDRTPKMTLPVKAKTNIDGIIIEIKKAEKLLTTKGKKEVWSGTMLLKSVSGGMILDFSSGDGFKSATIPLTAGWDILCFEGVPNTKVMSALWYISQALQAISTVTNVVQIEIGKDVPVCITPQLPFKGELNYWIAPRIEEEPAGAGEVRSNA